MAARPADADDTLLVALSAVVLPGRDAPVAPQDTAATLDRLELTGRTVILAGRDVGGRRLPEDPDERDRWVRGTTGAAAIPVVSFEPPPWDHHEEGSEAAAVARWDGLRVAQRAAWLITDRPEDVRPARGSGLRVILVGPRGQDQPLATRPDLEARDLADAARLLLAQDLFGSLPAG